MTTQKQHQSQSRRSASNWLQSLARLFSIILAIMIVAMSTYWGMKFYEEWQNKQAETERNEQLGLSHDEVTDEDKANHTVDGADKPKLLSIPAAGVQNARVQEIGLLSPSSNGSQQMDAPQNVHRRTFMMLVGTTVRLTLLNPSAVLTTFRQQEQII